MSDISEPSALSPAPPPRPGRLQGLLGGLPREVGVLTAVAFAVALGFGIVAPAIALFAKSFGVSNFWAGAVISAFALMRFVSAPFAGFAVNKSSERLVLATGMLIVATSSALAGLANGFWQLLVLRGAGGIGSAMFTVSAAALLLRVVEPHQRARASGAFQSGFLVGGVTGPLFGGLLTSISYRLPFFVYSATLVLAGGIGLVFLSQSRLQAREAKVGTDEPPTPLRVALRSQAYWAAVTNNFSTGWALFGLRMSLLPVFVVEGLSLSPAWVGYGLLTATLAQGVMLVPAGRVSDTRGRKGAMLTGASMVALSLVLLGLLENPLTYLMSMLMFGVGSAFLGTTSIAVVGDVIGGRGGPAISVFQMAQDAGAVVGPLVAGALSDAASYAVAFAASAGVAAIGALLASLMPETLRSPPQTDGSPADGPADQPGAGSSR